MTLREFFARPREFFGNHRIASAVAAPAILGVAAAVVATGTVVSNDRTADTRLRASVTECHDMVTISVAGRRDTPDPATTKMLVGANGELLPAALSGDHSSEWVDPVVNAPDDDVAAESYAAVYIEYPANMATYEDAVNEGVANTEQVMQEISAACPDTEFAIVGYSEGADVVRRVAMDIGNAQPGQDGAYAVVDPDDVVGVVILADSGRAAGDGPFPGAQDPTHPDGYDTAYQNGGVPPVSGKGALPGTGGGFGALDGKVASFCSEGDLTCAAPENIALLQLVVNVARQVNADALEAEGLTPATGQDVAVALGRIAMLAFADIQSQPNWMAGDETFLEVLLRVSDPQYVPGSTPPAAEPVSDGAVTTAELAPLAYLPRKVLNEIIGLIVTNQNTIPVIMSDPYNLTLGPNASGHHFDYWDNADPANGRPLTSAEYAAAWLTHLAKQAEAGEKVQTTAQPTEQDVVEAARAVAVSESPAAEQWAATTTTDVPSATSTTRAPSTTADSRTGAVRAEGTTPAQPSTSTAPSGTTSATQSGAAPPAPTDPAPRAGAVVGTPEAVIPPTPEITEDPAESETAPTTQSKASSTTTGSTPTTTESAATTTESARR